MTQLTEERVREIFREEMEKASAAISAALGNGKGVYDDGLSIQKEKQSKVKDAFLLYLENFNKD
ncbi:hypothetical protein JOD82_005421 [Paenibacillus sp. 1182]|uniref:hypothetical protein n=1 Tax=Paenibacillus sp. 1182 TaxID=2806565 RepID=UPI001AE9C406|nr:hypothetical protein [Paenibacillus sp. 1182]MBP1312276.1 hypothetical protein [Paenibacillus sp. 1182]